MKRSTFLAGTAACGAFVAIGAPGRADVGPLRVGMTGDYRPYGLLATDGSWSGLDVEVARALAAARGAALAIVATSWPTMTADLLAGTFEVAMGGVSIDPKRAAAGALTQPYVDDGKVALVRATDRARFGGLADFDVPSVRVAVNPGGTNASFVHDRLTHATVDVVPTNLSIPALVASGKADVMFTDGVEATLAAASDPRLVVLNPGAPYTHLQKAYFLRNDEPELLAFIDMQLALYERDGRLPRWRERFIGSNANDPARSHQAA